MNAASCSAFFLGAGYDVYRQWQAGLGVAPRSRYCSQLTGVLSWQHDTAYRLVFGTSFDSYRQWQAVSSTASQVKRYNNQLLGGVPIEPRHQQAGSSNMGNTTGTCSRHTKLDCCHHVNGNLTVPPTPVNNVGRFHMAAKNYYSNFHTFIKYVNILH